MKKILPGSKLPTERGLAEELGVNRMSLRQALLSLENTNSIFRIDRRGRFVSQAQLNYDPQQHISFRKAASEQGVGTWCDIRQVHFQASTKEAELFGIKSGGRLLRVYGWGAFNGHRIFVHDVLIKLSVAPDFGDWLADQSLTDVWIKQYGIQPVLSDLMIRPVRLEGEPQQLLGCTNGASGLYLRSIKRTNMDVSFKLIANSGATKRSKFVSNCEGHCDNVWQGFTSIGT
ncbi:MAG: DNA-binding GntR family transcriptional regulator [Granulosicoccus sp.]|jgi:DNA-binding GntR family transcriptional regulator